MYLVHALARAQAFIRRETLCGMANEGHRSEKLSRSMTYVVNETVGSLVAP